MVVGQPNFRARQLGRELAKMREIAELTQEEAGAPVRFSFKKISRIEQGQLPDFHGLQALLRTYRVPATRWPQYERLWEQARSRGWWHRFAVDNKHYLSLEHEAARLREFQLGLVPALLQTEEYATRLFTATAGKTGQWTAREVEARLRRQERLTGDPALELHVVLDEAVLRHPLDPGVRRRQFLRVLDAAELPNVTVQVLPHGAGTDLGLFGAFLVLGFDTPEDPDVAYVEHPLGDVVVDAAPKVETANLAFGRLTAAALDPAGSLELLDRLS